MSERPKYCARQHPRTSANILGLFGRQMEGGSFGIIRKREKDPISGRYYGGIAEIMHPSVALGGRGHPWRVWTEDGSLGIITQ